MGLFLVDGKFCQLWITYGLGEWDSQNMWRSYLAWQQYFSFLLLCPPSTWPACQYCAHPRGSVRVGVFFSQLFPFPMVPPGGDGYMWSGERYSLEWLLGPAKIGLIAGRAWPVLDTKPLALLPYLKIYFALDSGDGALNYTPRAV